jgi:hypothetical protein
LRLDHTQIQTQKVQLPSTAGGRPLGASRISSARRIKKQQSQYRADSETQYGEMVRGWLFLLRIIFGLAGWKNRFLNASAERVLGVI